MCGIVGSINFKRAYRHSMEATLRQLIWADTLRGADATGIYCLDKNKKVDWVKQCVDGWTFASNNTHARKVLAQAEEHIFIMGHNRAATQGAHDNADFAHPVIIEKKLGLVHNGTLTSWPQKLLSDDKKRIIHDSTAIASIIQTDGVQDFVNKCYGSWSLVWHDVKAGTFNFYRNEDRPMAFVYTDDIIFFGSELGLLMWVIQRNGFKPVKHFYTKPQTLYTFAIGESEPTVTRIERKYGSHTHYGSDDRFPRALIRPIGFQYGDGASSRVHNPDVDDEHESDAVRLERAREVRRLHEDGERRDREIEQEAEETGTGDSQGTTRRNRGKQSNVRALHGGQKPHVRQLDSWKEFKLGEPLMFSITDYGEVHDHDNGPQFNIQGEPAASLEFPEIQIKATIKTKTITPLQIQHSDKFFWGVLSTIMATDNGNVIMWVKDIVMSKIDDPGCVIRGSAQKLVEDKAGEVFSQTELEESEEDSERLVYLPPAVEAALAKDEKKENQKASLENKEFCQGCSAVTPKQNLRFLQETSIDPVSGRDVQHLFRYCEACIIAYGENRDSVVPQKLHGLQPKNADVRSFH